MIKNHIINNLKTHLNKLNKDRIFLTITNKQIVDNKSSSMCIKTLE